MVIKEHSNKNEYDKNTNKNFLYCLLLITWFIIVKNRTALLKTIKLITYIFTYLSNFSLGL